MSRNRSSGWGYLVEFGVLVAEHDLCRFLGAFPYEQVLLPVIDSPALAFDMQLEIRGVGAFSFRPDVGDFVRFVDL